MPVDVGDVEFLDLLHHRLGFIGQVSLGIGAYHVLQDYRQGLGIGLPQLKNQHVGHGKLRWNVDPLDHLSDFLEHLRPGHHDNRLGPLVCLGLKRFTGAHLFQLFKEVFKVRDGILRLGVAQDKESHIHQRHTLYIQLLDNLVDDLEIQWFGPDNDRTGPKIGHGHNLWRLRNFRRLSILHHGLFRSSVYIEQCLGQALRIGLLQLISPKLGFTIHDGDG